MNVRLGDKVICNKCNRSEPCVGTVIGTDTWYGKKIVNVLFGDAKWYQCDHDVIYLSDLEPMPKRNGVRYYQVREKSA